METTRTLEEKKIARKYYIGGIVAYLLVTLFIIITKIIYWDSISFWWIFLPSGVLIGFILFLLFQEMTSRGKN